MPICEETSRTQSLISWWSRTLPHQLRTAFWVPWLLSGLILASSLSISGCQSCSSTRPLAKLMEKQGQVDRDKAAEQEKWFSAEKGSEFEVGDAIRTAETAGARLDLDDGSILGLEEKTMVRFLDREPGSEEQALDLLMGEASLIAPEAGTTINTAFGLARLEGGSKIQLSRTGDQLLLQVMVGRAKVENGEGGSLDATAGQTIVATLGQAILELVEDGEALPVEDEKGPTTDTPAEEPEPELAPIQATISGDTVSVQAPGAAEASPVPSGTQAVESGSVVKVGQGSSVKLSQGSSEAQLSQGTYVVGGNNQLVQSDTSAFTISSSKKITLKVPGGFITTTGGQATITPLGSKGTRVQAKSGAVQVVGKNKAQLYAGNEGTISQDGVVKASGQGLDYADIDVGVGQTMVIHDPRPPTAVRFVFGDSCELGRIDLKGKNSALPSGAWAIGRKGVSLAIAGRAEYSLRCVDDAGKLSAPTGGGRITVIHDAGTRPVPKKAPATSIDVNGRGYTVLYQNQLPRVTVRWSSAPSADKFVLKRSGQGVSRNYSTSTPAYTFAPGALGEGTHSFYFEGGGRVSRRSSVTIRFDNATPTASLQTPANSGVASGGQLHLQGMGLPGWTVMVDGQAVAQDAEGRFSVNTTMPANGRPAALILSHPSRGNHVYLRRPSGAR